VSLGNGDGTFQAARNFGAGSSPRSVAVADFNHDGKLDLAVANWGCNGFHTCPVSNVSVLLGNGDGTFQPARDFAVGEAPVSVVVGDFNGDGVPDLAVANAGDPQLDEQSGSVSLLLGVGDGTFRPGVSLSAGLSPSSLAMGDFNGDGKLDLAVTDCLSGSVWVLLGNGDGSFQEGKSFASDSAANGSPEGIAVGDFNGDGKSDLPSPLNRWDTFSLLLGNGDGTFGAAASFAAGGAPEAVAVGDFNGDGIADVAGINSASGTVSLLLGSGNGGFQAAGSFHANSSLFSMVVADFNNDGRLDLVTPGSILLGNGDGSFQLPRAIVAGSDPFSAAAGDFNGDGKLDLAIVDNGSSSIFVLFGNGDGTFQPAVTLGTGVPARSVAVGDFNGDSKLDLAVANVGCLNCPPSTVSVLLGNGDGTFQAARIFPAGGDPQSVAISDLNGDGKLDLVIADAVSGATVLLGNGDGTFQPAQFFAAGGFPTSIAVGDFNQDGILDLVVTNSTDGGSPGAVLLLIGNGNGTFQTAQNLVTGGDLWSVALGDFDGDGKPDLALANADFAYVLLGNGDGTFQSPASFAASGDGLSVGVGDFDGDGRPDLAISNLSSTLSVLKNNTTVASYSLTVRKSGNGSGTVVSNRAGINCGPNCVASYAKGALATLAAQPATLSTFGGWRGCDTVIGTTCSVSMTAAKSVTATFNLRQFTLTINKRGSGSGTVTSTSIPGNTAQIRCGAACSTSYLSGAVVTLTAAPAFGSFFLGWAGCETTSGSKCTVRMEAEESVAAIFIGGPSRWSWRGPTPRTRRSSLPVNE